MAQGCREGLCALAILVPCKVTEDAVGRRPDGGIQFHFSKVWLKKAVT